jgi:predicted histone-like DNA-binding protein
MDVLVERYQRRKQVSDKNSPKLFYLRQIPKTCGKVDTKTLAAAVQKNCAMTKGDVKHVIEALVEEIQANLANGNKVKLDQLGTFHMTFRCPGVETSDKCTVKNITRVNIRFVPGKELRLVNGTTTRTESPANVSFALDKEDEDSGSGSGNTGGTGDSGTGGSGSGSGDSGVIDDNPLG